MIGCMKMSSPTRRIARLPRRPAGDYRTAVTDNQGFPSSTRRSAVLLDPGLRLESSECLIGLHPERNERDRRLSGVDMFATCSQCGLLKSDWDTTHPEYLPWSEKCPICKE